MPESTRAAASIGYTDGSLLDKLAVADLISVERAARDNSDWVLMADMHAPDAVARMAWFSGPVSALIEASRAGGRGGLTLHRLSPSVVAVAGDRALAETRVVIETRTEQDGVAVDITSHCRYVHRVVRTGSGWRISRIDCICEKDRLAPVLPGPVLKLDPTQLARYRATYRFVSYNLNSRGVTVDEDLPGVDRPEQLAQFYADSRDWLID